MLMVDDFLREAKTQFITDYGRYLSNLGCTLDVGFGSAKQGYDTIETLVLRIQPIKAISAELGKEIKATLPKTYYHNGINIQTQLVYNPNPIKPNSAKR
jgi:hypothetical protein